MCRSLWQAATAFRPNVLSPGSRRALVPPDVRPPGASPLVRSTSDVIPVASATLLEIFERAFRTVGDADAPARAVAMVRRFGDELGIHDTARLAQALSNTEVVADVKCCMRGLLYPALRRALFWHRARIGLLAEKRTGRLATLVRQMEDKTCHVGKGKHRRLELVLADMTQLSAIDQVTQTFKAALFIILRFKDGALDSDLVKEYDGFPVNSDGTPSFLPSARWFLNQVEFSNGHSLQFHETKVINAGNDLKLVLRLEGVFFERFELQAFPFDVQELGVTVAVKCATNGKMPLTIVDEAASCRVLTDHFAYADVWELDPTIRTEVGVVGPLSRQFPAVHLRAMVRRRPGFTLINVAAPSMVICGLPATVFAVEVEYTSDKLAINLAILLTAVTFKYVTAQYLPQIPYLTLVDKYVFVGSANIVLATLCNAVMGFMQLWGGASDELLRVVNITSFIVVIAFWVATQLLFVVLAFRALRRLPSEFEPAPVADTGGRRDSAYGDAARASRHTRMSWADRFSEGIRFSRASRKSRPSSASPSTNSSSRREKSNREKSHRSGRGADSEPSGPGALSRYQRAARGGFIRRHLATPVRRRPSLAPPPATATPDSTNLNGRKPPALISPRHAGGSPAFSV